MSQSIFNKSNQSELQVLLFLIKSTRYASDNMWMHFLKEAYKLVRNTRIGGWIGGNITQNKLAIGYFDVI
jgi:hypothetical protein